ncbi:glycosyltransferase family 4 protein [Anaeromyxobacter sp. Fw109-5]|uniref:glycosyltransferase family 4 protein n=1 Tax=Anaeromyxobacter sp. (strain Fw109-5) TaxID=404589 RepID=UPI0000ED6D8A|nr:MraY family glycosyltransferase [Anaeromyxobacter sp. Fw109-5]ABS28611.1 glycosyl transferase family 4 [Anaeromyxobacter sp. Fw109-5]
MTTAAVAFVAATVTGAVLTPFVRTLAHRMGALDHALTSRKVHGKPIPRLGGIAIVLAFFAPLVALLFVNSGVGGQFYAMPRRAFGLFAGGLAIAALGVLDDLKGANAKTKFAVQFGVAGLMYWLGYRIDVIANPFGPDIQLGMLGLPFTLLWIAGVINALNLIDGLDGLAGGVALIAVTTTCVVALRGGEPLMVLFTAALAGAVLGFLFYNFNPATIFMGDTGSMFLGFVLATTAIQTNRESSSAVALLVPIIALGVPIADTLLAMARRAARGAPLFSADRGHIHHRLLDLGLSHKQTVLVIYGACAVLGAVAISVAYSTASQAILFLLALAAVAYLALRRLGFVQVNLSDTQRMLEDRRRNLEVRASIRRLGARLREASGLGEVWDSLRLAATVLEARAIALHLPGDAANADAYSAGFDDAGLDLFRARYGLLPERPGDTHLELGWDDGRAFIDRDTEIAVELLCEHVADALERIDRPARLTPVEGLRRVVGLRR